MDEQKAQAASTQSPSTETQPTPTTVDPKVASDGAQTDGAEQPGEATADWRKVLDGVDTKELRTHPKLAGLIGELANRQAQELAKNAENVEVERRVQQELRELRRKDPVGYAEKMEAIEAERDSNTQRDQQLWGQFLIGLKDRFDALPAEVKHKMQGRQYTNLSLVQAQKAFVEDLLDAEKAPLDKGQLDEARKDAVEAGKAEARTEMAASKKNPDLSAGTAVAPLTQTEWDRHRGDSDWRRGNAERIQAGVSSGAIRR